MRSVFIHIRIHIRIHLSISKRALEVATWQFDQLQSCLFSISVCVCVSAYECVCECIHLLANID